MLKEEAAAAKSTTEDQSQHSDIPLNTEDEIQQAVHADAQPEKAKDISNATQAVPDMDKLSLEESHTATKPSGNTDSDPSSGSADALSDAKETLQSDATRSDSSQQAAGLMLDEGVDIDMEDQESFEALFGRLKDMKGRRLQKY